MNTERVSVMSVSGATELPADVQADVDARIRWLRDELLPELDLELGVPYPPVHVPMTLWRSDFHPRAGAMAVAGVRRHGDRDRYVVLLPAGTLRQLTDDAIREVLAHEFLHVVYHTQQCVAAFREGRTPTLGVSLDAWDSPEAYLRSEEASLASTEWLSPRLRELLGPPGIGPDPGDVVDPAVWRSPWPKDAHREHAPRTSPPPPNFSMASLEPGIVAKLDARGGR
jgi:hypothetical protein